MPGVPPLISAPVNPFPHEQRWNPRFGAKKHALSRPGARRVSAASEVLADPVEHKLGRLRRDRKRVEHSAAGSASELRSRWEEVTAMRDQLQAVARRGSLQGGGGAVQALLQEANAEAEAIGRASRLLRRFDILDSGRRALIDRLQRLARAVTGQDATQHLLLVGGGGLVMRELSLLVERLREQTIHAAEAWSHLQGAAAGIGSGGGLWQERDILDEYAAEVSQATEGSGVAEVLGFGMTDNPFLHPSCPPVREHAVPLQPYTQMRIEELLGAMGAQYSYIPAPPSARLNSLRRAPLTALPPLGLPAGPPVRLPQPARAQPKPAPDMKSIRGGGYGGGDIASLPPARDTDAPKDAGRDKPLTDKPVIEKPVIEKPVIEKPVIEKPVIEKPATPPGEKPAPEHRSPARDTDSPHSGSPWVNPMIEKPAPEDRTSPEASPKLAVESGPPRSPLTSPGNEVPPVLQSPCDEARGASGGKKGLAAGDTFSRRQSNLGGGDTFSRRQSNLGGGEGLSRRQSNL
eukprot:Hpha_TRINITY_DN13860_c0_g2::TRINITY_DN13860_c0_g2_i2::g.69768::m.69768